MLPSVTTPVPLSWTTDRSDDKLLRVIDVPAVVGPRPYGRIHANLMSDSMPLRQISLM